VGPTSAPALESDLERHRFGLTGYCYRMLGSGSEAEDAVQETMVRAWRAGDRLEARAALQGWLYRIAHNVCCDMLASAQRRALPMDLGPASPADGALGGRVEAAWVEPIADARVMPPEADPAQVAELRESLRLAFVAALQHLPPRQRAVLILCEVLRWRASEAAELLEASVAAVTSALQRARATLAALDLEPAAVRTAQPGDEQRLLEAYMDAFERYDMDALTDLLRDDAAFTMPPFELWVRGTEEIVAFMTGAGAKCEGSRLVPTAANCLPAAAIYNPAPDGGFLGWAIVLLEPVAGRVAALHHFIGPHHFRAFALPDRLGGEWGS
jgi:RNA polymerase sigma-70 factor (ECF subfamily)